MTIVNRSSYYGIDIFKFFFAIVVIAIHTEPFKYYRFIHESSLYDAICAMAVPYFFISFGFLLFKKTHMESSNQIATIILKAIYKIMKL